MRTALALLISFATAPVFAEDFQLRPPLNCGPTTNTPCIIQQYVDRDPSTGVSDFTCGTLSYDGHKGTDFRVPTQAQMQNGVTVIASAAGRIKAVRDGMPDILTTAPNAPDVSGRECGNGVVINHGDGWETQYCHLQNGSISVTRGDKVVAGDPLGQIGLSGLTAFPHVHLSVRKDGQVIDPFKPTTDQTCGPATEDLWDDLTQPNYQAGGLLDVGFHDAVPEFSQLKQGSIAPRTLPTEAPALVIWAYMFGSQPDDRLRLNIQGPNGWSFIQDVKLDRAQAELFRASGKRRPPQGWDPGTYQGTVNLIRNGQIIDTRRVSIEING